MHKFFAKPLFLGKKVVFLPQCHSTNDELVVLCRKSGEPEGLVLYTDDQTKGKGQRGNLWLAESGKNILMSLLLKPKFLNPSDQFYLNLIAGLAIVDTLKEFSDKEVVLKWPNDVYLNERKVAGVLIESNLRGNSIESAVVGIGLNVNQKGFSLPSATSLFIETGSLFDRLEVMDKLISKIEKWYLCMKIDSKSLILDEYHKLLMWRGEERTFKADGLEFVGEIIGIDKYGKLAIHTNGELRTFGIKEVEFVG